MHEPNLTNHAPQAGLTDNELAFIPRECNGKCPDPEERDYLVAVLHRTGKQEIFLPVNAKQAAELFTYWEARKNFITSVHLWERSWRNVVSAE